jgi:ParB family chromosome partitioning protein
VKGGDFVDNPARYMVKDRQAFRRIPVGQIMKNPNQPRRIFEHDALQELADSIRQYGIITPLTVRKKEGCYELIAGERRLRAAKLAGLETVPCYIMAASEEDSGLMALIENLQRRDLSFFEEALSLQRLTRLYGLTQQQAAERIGKSQSAVANKLRLLRLAPATMEVIRTAALSERHARALLRLEDPDTQAAAAQRIVDDAMTVEQAEGYIEALLSGPKPQPVVHGQRRQMLVRDVRIFFNTVDRAVSAMQGAGIGVQIDRRQEGEDIILTVRVPAAKAPTIAPQPETERVSCETAAV